MGKKLSGVEADWLARPPHSAEVAAATCRLTEDSWHRLQHARDSRQDKQIRSWMDGWNRGCKYVVFNSEYIQRTC